MKDQDYIRKGVELADGWRIVRATDVLYVQSSFTGLCLLTELSQGEIDALAAQLVRQVDVLKHIFFASYQGDAFVYKIADNGEIVKLTEESTSNRTMNTIKAIIDSGVLTK